MLPIYLDDCADHNLLAILLRNAGHKVQTPRNAGTSGVVDIEHLEYAASYNYVLLTFNPSDFQSLHHEWQTEGRRHAGIFLIYQDNDVAKDMKYTDIVRSIKNLLASGLPIANELHILNHWR